MLEEHQIKKIMKEKCLSIEAEIYQRVLKGEDISEILSPYKQLLVTETNNKDIVGVILTLSNYPLIKLVSIEGVHYFEYNDLGHYSLSNVYGRCYVSANFETKVLPKIYDIFT